MTDPIWPMTTTKFLRIVAPEKAALLIDADNVGHRAIREYLKSILPISRFRFHGYYITSSHSGFPKKANKLENWIKTHPNEEHSTDDKIIIKARELAQTKKIKTIIIASQDSDFIPIHKEIKEEHKTTSIALHLTKLGGIHYINNSILSHQIPRPTNLNNYPKSDPAYKKMGITYYSAQGVGTAHQTSKKHA